MNGKKLTERQLLDIASRHVRVPWEHWVRIAGEIAKGRYLPVGEDRVAVPLTPLTADYSALYPIMRDFVGLLTWDPGNLFTIILDRKGEKVLRCYIEVTRDNNFIDLKTVDSKDPILQSVVELFHSEKRHEIRKLLDLRCREKFGIAINWVKIASIDFFGSLADCPEAYERDGLQGWFKAVYAGVEEIYRKDLIHFVPEPPVFARLRELMTSILQLDFRHIDTRGIFGPVFGRRARDKTVAVILKGRDYVAAIKIGGDHPTHLTYPMSLTRPLLNVPMKHLAKEAKKILGCDMAIALRAEPVANLFYEALFHEMPYETDDTTMILFRALEIVRQFGLLWSIDPMPFYLKDWIRKTGLLFGNPFDISKLSTWFLPGLALNGEKLFLGMHNRRTTVILDDRHILAAMTIEFYNGGIRGIKTIDPDTLADLVSIPANNPDDARKQAQDIAYRLWDQGFGFQSQVFLFQKSFIKSMTELMSIQTFKTLFGSWRAVPAAMEIVRLVKRGAFIVTPDLMFRKVEAWVQDSGRFSVYRSLLKVPFDTKRKRTRGLLYVKETVAAAFILGLLSYWIFF